MLMDIKKLLFSILKEDYFSDKENRSKAETLYNSVYNKIDELEPEDFKYITVRGDQGEQPAMSLRASKILPEYKDLVFIFVGDRFSYKDGKIQGIERLKNHYSFVVDSDLITIPISCVPLENIEELDEWGEDRQDTWKSDYLYYIKSGFSNRASVIHEIIHYLDKHRYTSTYTGGGYKNPFDNEYRDYLSQPSEYNAVFQSQVSKVDNIIKTKLESKETLKLMLLDNFDDFNSFREFYADCFNIPTTSDYWNSDYYKKINKRLFQYFENKKKELEDILNSYE